MDDRSGGDRSVPDRERLERAIDAQEGLRGVVPDEVVDAAVAALRAQLEAPNPESQRRRQVTVMFADVSGFTSMSSRLDPEAVADVINELWARLDAVIAEHGGRIDKHIGDAVMAVWGMTSTGEDDPERAVRAGLAMQQELERRRPDHDLRMRVGISTGPVHLGAVGAGAEFTAIGDTVNIASRVQNLAPLGGVLVTHDTYRHVRGVFDVDEVAPATVKGKDEPIRTYVVRRAKDRAFRMPTRGVEGVETQMVGRATELAVLSAEFERVVAEQVLRLVTITGDAGVGKSRLLYEFENWIDLHPVGAYFFKGRALATRQSVAFGLARDLVGDRFGVQDSDPASVVADKLRAGFGPALSASEADVAGHWLGFDLRASAAVHGLLGSGELAAAARAHLIRYLELLSADGPVVVFLEDLHWADVESLVLLDDLVAELADARMLVVGVGRPSLRDRPEAERLLERSSAALHLGPLDPGASRSLVEEVLQKVPLVPDELADLIVTRADGNAFYVEELVKMLVEDGVIETGEAWDPWRVHLDRLDPERVPATLTGVLQTRLDSLAPEERTALQRSSVVGRVFWDGTVASLGADSIEATSRSLEAARERELVFRKDHSSFDDNVEYTFKHALLRDVTYETVLLRDRQRLHRLVARWITDHAGERLTEYAGLIAMHHQLAGELASAAELLHRAGAASLEAGNSGAAYRSLQEAFELWRTTGSEPTVGALTTMADARLRLGDVDDGHRYIEEALRRATTPEDRVAARYLASWIAAERGDREREQALLEEAQPEAEQIGGVLLVRVLTGLAWSKFLGGDTASAYADAHRARATAETIGYAVGARNALAGLSAIAGTTGDFSASLRYGLDALAVATQSGDLEGQALAHNNLGVAHHLLGDERAAEEEYLVALEHYRQGKSIDLRLGRRLQVAMTSANIGQIHVRLGDDAGARREIHEALTTARDAGSTSILMFCVQAEADRRLTNGEVASALEMIGVVAHQPALTSYDQAEIERILNRAGLSSEVIEPSVAGSWGDDFGVVVDRLIADLAQWLAAARDGVT